MVEVPGKKRETYGGGHKEEAKNKNKKGKKNYDKSIAAPPPLFLSLRITTCCLYISVGSVPRSLYIGLLRPHLLLSSISFPSSSRQLVMFRRGGGEGGGFSLLNRTDTPSTLLRDGKRREREHLNTVTLYTCMEYKSP